MLSLLSSMLMISISCQSNTVKNTESVKTEQTAAQTANFQKPLTEGKISARISFPSLPLDKVFSAVDPSKGDIHLQMQKTIEKLNENDRKKIETYLSNNPTGALGIMFLPMLKNDLFFNQGNATAKCDGLTYHLENSIDLATKSGIMYVENRTKDIQKLNFRFTETSFDVNNLKTKIDNTKYDIKSTGETKNVAGVECTKAIYTPKDKSDLSLNKLEVWTSKQLPKSLNFLHPYYIEENSGIALIDIFLPNTTQPLIRYEFVNISNEKISPENLAIKSTEPLYDADKDMNTVSMKMLGIMMSSDYR